MAVLRLPNTNDGSSDEDEYDDEAIDMGNDELRILKDKNQIIQRDKDEEEETNIENSISED